MLLSNSQTLSDTISPYCNHFSGCKGRKMKFCCRMTQCIGDHYHIGQISQYALSSQSVLQNDRISSRFFHPSGFSIGLQFSRLPYVHIANAYNGKNGFLVSVGNLPMLADRIMRLMEDEGLRKRMGMNAYHNSKTFSEERIMQCWIDMFDKLVSQR